jgi:hypothetical protein
VVQEHFIIQEEAKPGVKVYTECAEMLSPIGFWFMVDRLFQINTAALSVTKPLNYDVRH